MISLQKGKEFGVAAERAGDQRLAPALGLGRFVQKGRSRGRETGIALDGDGAERPSRRHRKQIRYGEPAE